MHLINFLRHAINCKNNNYFLACIIFLSVTTNCEKLIAFQTLQQQLTQFNHMDNFALPELFLSFDVETDGKSPINNLLSIGICGLTKNKDIIFTFSENINPLPNHPQESSTMEFWNRTENTIAWNKLLENRNDYKDVFKSLSDQFSTLSKKYKLTFIAQPSAFDWMFFKYYYEKAQYDLAIPFYDIGYSCICISTTWKTFIAVKKLNNNEAKQLKLQLSAQNDGIEHLAIDDAKNQGLFYVNLINHFA